MKSLLKLIQSDYGISFIGKISSIFVGLLSSIFYIRYLGIEYKGEYSYIKEIASIASIILNLGIYQSYPYYYRKNKENIYYEYLKIFNLQFLLYASAMLILICSINRSITTCLILLQIPVLVLKLQLDNVVLIEKFRVYVIIDIVYKIVLCLFYVVLWLFVETNLVLIIVGTAIVDLLCCLAYLLFTHALPFNVGLKVDYSFLKAVVNFGFFPMLSALLLMLNYTADIIFLKLLGEPKELSLYSTAAVVINYVWIFPNAFKDVLIGQVARKHDEEKVSFSVKISIAITVIVFIIFILIGRFLVTLVFGKSFAGCYEIILILFFGTFSMIFFKMFGTVFVTDGKRVIYFIILLVSVSINIIANYVLIPIMGMYGAAISSVVSYDVCGIAFLLAYCRYKRTKVTDYLFFKKSELKKLKSRI